MTIRQTFSYTNSTAGDVQVIVEPWAEQFVLRPGQRVEIVVRSESTVGSIEFEQLSTGLIIYGYEGCVVSLSSDGEALVPSTQQ